MLVVHKLLSFFFTHLFTSKPAKKIEMFDFLFRLIGFILVTHGNLKFESHRHLFLCLLRLETFSKGWHEHASEQTFSLVNVPSKSMQDNKILFDSQWKIMCAKEKMWRRTNFLWFCTQRWPVLKVPIERAARHLTFNQSSQLHNQMLARGGGCYLDTTVFLKQIITGTSCSFSSTKIHQIKILP